MAYDDTLFQLGMDLTRSSTAQKEDLFETAPTSTGRTNSSSSGRSIILDMIGVTERTSAAAVEKTLRNALGFLNTESYEISSGHESHRGSQWVSAEASDGVVRLESWPGSGFMSVNVSGTNLTSETTMIALAKAFGAREAILRPTKQASLATRYAKRHATNSCKPIPLAKRARGTANTGRVTKAA